MYFTCTFVPEFVLYKCIVVKTMDAMATAHINSTRQAALAGCNEVPCNPKIRPQTPGLKPLILHPSPRLLFLNPKPE